MTLFAPPISALGNSHNHTPDVQPEDNFVESAMPAAYHPAGHVLPRQDASSSFNRMEYARDNWESRAPWPAISAAAR